MASPYLTYFPEFIANKNLSGSNTFSMGDVVSWIAQRYGRKAGDIEQHLLKRTTNYPGRTAYKPPAGVQDDIFFRLPDCKFRLYQPGTDPPPLRDADSFEAESDESPEIGARRQRQPTRDLFGLEKTIQSVIATNPERIEPGMKVYESDGNFGFEYQTPIGRIDLLCKDRDDNFVVVELKAVGSSDQVAGQLGRYMGWTKENLAEPNQRVRGIIIAKGVSERLRLSAAVMNDVEVFEYELELTLRRVSKLASRSK
jgi:hypothetical protein